MPLLSKSLIHNSSARLMVGGCFVAARAIPPAGRLLQCSVRARPGRGGSAAERLIGPQLRTDPHDLDHPLDRGADVPVDLERAAALPGVLEPEDDRPHAGAVDELERGQIQPHCAPVVPEAAQPLLDGVRDRDVQLADQGKTDATVRVDALPYLEGWPGECQECRQCRLPANGAGAAAILASRREEIRSGGVFTRTGA